MQRFLHRIAQYRASNYFTGSIKQSLLTISTGYITLNAAGRQRAEDVLERHTLLADLLIRIGVSKETALSDACKVEHDLSEESFEAIKRALHSSHFS